MKVKKTKTQSKKKPFSTKDMPIVKLKKGTREEQCSPTQKLREITIPTKKIKSTKTASNSSFKVGEKVEKQILWMGKVSEKDNQKIHSIKDSVIYLADHEGQMETGITYDLSGKEIEGFFLPNMSSRIVKAKKSA